VVKAIIDAPFSHDIACGLREILFGENSLETERGVTLDEVFVCSFGCRIGTRNACRREWQAASTSRVSAAEGGRAWRILRAQYAGGAT
jgi:hypothetical protein